MQASEKGAFKARNGHMVFSDICVCCGEPVPEGRQVCWQCEHEDSGDALEELNDV